MTFEPAEKISSGTLRRRAVRLGVWVAILLVRPALSLGDSVPTIEDARAIRTNTVAAKMALQTAWAYAAARDTTYWTALRDGEAKVVRGYQISLAAAWPTTLSAAHDTIHTSLSTTIENLAGIDKMGSLLAVADIRAVLDNEIARIDRTNQVLMGVMPSEPPAAAAPAPAPTPAPTVPADVIPTIVAGSGFTAATSQPATVGTGPGADAKAIARWDVVPYQTITGKFAVGVVAFHMAGIDRVDFSVNGGAWTSVTAMTANPVTGVWEYNAYVDGTSLPDGQAEVRAIVRPKVGTPRVLAGAHDASDRSLVSGEYSLFLTANKGGTVPAPVRYVSATGSNTTGDGTAARPFATVAHAVADVMARSATADGATIHLAAGDHAYPNIGTGPVTSQRWLTIAAAPGVARESVRLTSSSGSLGLNTKLVKLKGITVRGTELPDNGAAFHRVWAEDCILEGSGPLDGLRFFPLGSWTGGIFVTESTIRNVKYPAYGQMLTRNTLLDTLGGDAFREPSGLVVNCEVKHLVSRDDTHNDVVQFWDPYPRTSFENIIFYGMKAVEDITAQALFVQQYGLTVRSDNFAFVNYLTYAPDAAQWQNPGTHVLLWNVGILSPASALTTSKGGLVFSDVTGGPARPTSVHDLSVRNSIFQRLNVLQTGAEPALSDRSWADNNHFVDIVSHLASAPGTNVTTGGDTASLFTDPARGDFSPKAGSPLLSRLQQLFVPADVSGRALTAPAAIGPVGATPAQ